MADDTDLISTTGAPTDTALDGVAAHLEERVQNTERFAAEFGANATAFFAELPALFRLFRRLPFDLELSLEVRRTAASVAFYIAEHRDFIDEAMRGDAGLVDDLWVAYAGLKTLVDEVGETPLERHWRGEQPLSAVVGLAHNLEAIAAKVPSKMLERAAAFLGVAPG